MNDSNGQGKKVDIFIKSINILKFIFLIEKKICIDFNNFISNINLL